VIAERSVGPIRPGMEHWGANNAKACCYQRGNEERFLTTQADAFA